MKSIADLLPETLEFCRQNSLLPAGGRIVVGLSGGPDSLALLDLLHRMAQRHGLTIVAAHLNHGLRGDASEADEAAVRRICDAYGVPLHVRRHDIRAEADARCQGIEETGRRIRYAFFESIARGEYEAIAVERERTARQTARHVNPEERHVLYRAPDAGPAGSADASPPGAAAENGRNPFGHRFSDRQPAPSAAAILQAGIRVAVGHHRNDQAETVLLNLGRGSGIDGLVGMRPQNGLIIRPLLDIPRADIDAYIRWRGLEPCLDATNFDMEATRNRLRHRVLPALSEAFGFDAVAPLARAARLLRQDADCLQQQAEAALARLRAGAERQPAQSLPGQVSALMVRDAAALHPAILGRVLRLWYRETFGDVRDLAESQVAGLIGLCASGRSGRRCSLPNGRQAVRNFDWLILLAPVPQNAAREPAPGLLAPVPQNAAREPAPGLLASDAAAAATPNQPGLQKIYEPSSALQPGQAIGSHDGQDSGAARPVQGDDAIRFQKINVNVESPPNGVVDKVKTARLHGPGRPETTIAASGLPDACDAGEACPLQIPGVTDLPGGGRFVTQFIVDQAQIVYNDRTWCFTAPTLAGAVARFRRPHDHIRVEGSLHGKLLKKFLCERQVPADLRDRLPLVARDATILWIPGVAASERLPAVPDPAAIPPGQWVMVRHIRPEAAADGSQP